MDAKHKAITIAIMAMGGEGGGVLADWIVDMAEGGGYYAQSTSVPGVAQRTGATIYYVELFPEAAVQTAGKPPVLSLMPVPGEVDVVVASELMEAGRAIQRGLVTRDRTTLIASTHRVYSMTERTALGDGRMDSANLVEAGEAAAKVFVKGDFARIADETSSVISAALFGALASTGVLPFARDQFEQAVQHSGIGLKSSLAAFSAGFSAASASPAQVTGKVVASQPKVGPRLRVLADRISTAFPPSTHAILLAGVERLADYQDERYAIAFLDLLEPVRDADTQCGPGDYALLRETGRYLALWFSYEDAIRVADLKTRRLRFERVREEARAGQTQVLQIHEFLHPQVQEMADILPAPLGRWLLKTSWVKSLINRSTKKGMTLQTTSLSGYLQLYVLASLRPWRPKSLRYQEERKHALEWLARIPELAREDYALAVEVAECPRLIKGYGDTHRNGSRNFDALMGILPRLRRHSHAAASLRRLREVALEDENGKKLASELQKVCA